MSRYTNENEEITESQYALWQANVERAAKGRRGQSFLLQLEAALLALPAKRLARKVFYKDGDACLLGAVTAHCGKLPGEDYLIDLNEESTSETANFIAGTFDIAETLAWDLAYSNDEIWGGGWDPVAQRPTDSDEKRYQDALRWVQKRIVR